MTTVFDANLIPFLVALLVGVVIGWWMFRGVRRADLPRDAGARSEEAAPAPLERPYMRAKPVAAGPSEGAGLADQGAAATTDVAGQLLGVPAHVELGDASAPPDNLQTLKGVGPKLAARLNELGVVRFAQLARLGDNEVAILDAQLGPFKGRVARDRLVEQAAYLERGDAEGFAARFGNLGSTA